jgi:hypothetical protein
MPPEPGRIRPAVQQQDRDAVAVILDVEGDAVGLDDPAIVWARHDPIMAR